MMDVDLGTANVDRLQATTDARFGDLDPDAPDYVECEDCGAAGHAESLYFDDHFVAVEGTTYCVDCAEKHLVRCGACDQMIWKEDAVDYPGFDRQVCPECAERMKEEDKCA